MIVEADRGEDLGVVVSMAPRDSPLAATIFAACSSSMRYVYVCVYVYVYSVISTHLASLSGTCYLLSLI